MPTPFSFLPMEKGHELAEQIRHGGIGLSKNVIQVIMKALRGPVREMKEIVRWGG